MHSCTMNSSIIVVQPDIGFENVQIFAFATMFKFADIFDNFDFDFLFDFNCIFINESGYYFIICY